MTGSANSQAWKSLQAHVCDLLGGANLGFADTFTDYPYDVRHLMCFAKVTPARRNGQWSIFRGLHEPSAP
ncbi:hypothetical protein [Micromonospora pisi]|uniref:hypothetical protein n=1 Tax=Micromonospora pisi TaxID=589240 RepID=UPI0011C46081|nr:hypothetical protein [Micromonospora pisi]